MHSREFRARDAVSPSPPVDIHRLYNFRRELLRIEGEEKKNKASRSYIRTIEICEVGLNMHNYQQADYDDGIIVQLLQIRFRVR